MNRNELPLRQMNEQGVNMVDVKGRLSMKSVAWKVGKSLLRG